MMTRKYLGLDFHPDTMIAVAEGDRAGKIPRYGQISSDLHALEKVLHKPGGENIVQHVVYEAGPIK